MDAGPQLERISRWRFAPGIALAAAAFLLAVGVFAGYYEDRFYQAEKLQNTRIQAGILAASVAPALVFGDPRTAQEYVSALSQNPEVQAAGVYDQAGKLFARFVRSSGALPQRAPPVGAGYEESDVIAVVPVMQNAATIGSVLIRVVTETPFRRSARYGGIAILVVLSLLVVGVVGIAHRTLSRANVTLAAQAQDLRDAYRKLQTEMQERVRAEEALRQAQKMEAVGQLSGGIAHDFNNLITVAKGNVQIMLRRLGQGRTDVTRYTDAVNDALNRAAVLTQRLLAFARQQPLSPRSLSLGTLIQGIGPLLTHSVGPGIALKTKLNATWLTLCDANQMENVILNLAINARDAMPNGGELMIETKDVVIDRTSDDIPAGEYVELTVRDNGTGMSDEVRQRAMEPFFTTKPVGQGTGLGLSVAFGYIRQSNGHLMIESAPGRGTAVRILLPRHKTEPLSRSA